MTTLISLNCRIPSAFADKNWSLYAGVNKGSIDCKSKAGTKPVATNAIGCPWKSHDTPE